MIASNWKQLGVFHLEGNMRTVKGKKEIRRLYSFSTENVHWVRDNREAIEKSRKDAEDFTDYHPLSDIVETIYYTEVEEQVPDVYQMWYFACVKGEEKSFLCFDHDKEGLIESRNRRIETGHRCSEIKLLREEF
jgi:hypothetical protein